MGDIEVGVMRTGQDVLHGVPVRIHSSVLPQHMGVFATTGMGKSNFMKVFCAVMHAGEAIRPARRRSPW